MFIYLSNMTGRKMARIYEPAGSDVEQFPDFDPTSGLTGQTLIFNLKTNKLEIAYDRDDAYHGLCYREKWGGQFSNLINFTSFVNLWVER